MRGLTDNINNTAIFIGIIIIINARNWGNGAAAECTSCNERLHHQPLSLYQNLVSFLFCKWLARLVRVFRIPTHFFLF